MSLLGVKIVARCVILHLEFEDNLVWIELVSLAKDMDRHDLLHFVALVAEQALVHLLDFRQGLRREAGLESAVLEIMGRRLRSLGCGTCTHTKIQHSYCW